MYKHIDEYIRVYPIEHDWTLWHRGWPILWVLATDQIAVAPNTVKSRSLWRSLCWIRGRGVGVRGRGILRRLRKLCTVGRRKLLVKSQIVRRKNRIKRRWTYDYWRKKNIILPQVLIKLVWDNYIHVSSEKYMYNDNDIYILMNNSRPTCCESHRPGLM